MTNLIAKQLEFKILNNSKLFCFFSLVCLGLLSNYFTLNETYLYHDDNRFWDDMRGGTIFSLQIDYLSKGRPIFSGILIFMGTVC